MTPADSRVWKADGEISRSKKSETHHLPKGQGESQARGRSPMRLKGQEWRQQLLWKAGWRQHGTVKPRERMLGLTAGLQCTAPPLSHPPRKAPVHGGGGDTRHRRLGYKQSQTESNENPSRSLWDFGTPTFLCHRQCDMVLHSTQAWRAGNWGCFV